MIPVHCEATRSHGGFCSHAPTVALRAVAGVQGFDMDLEWWLCTFHARYWAVRRAPENRCPLIGDPRVVTLIEREREALSNQMDSGPGNEPQSLLPVGARVRHRRHQDLTGRIATHEYNQYGDLSPIPYGIAWDSPSHAFDLLGMLACYGSSESVQALSLDASSSVSPRENQGDQG